VTSGYATNMVAPAMPIAMGHGLVFVGLYALDVNAQFNYDRYFSIVPQGTEARLEFSRCFYQGCPVDGSQSRRRLRSSAPTPSMPTSPPMGRARMHKNSG
jgi:hypothetical protein